MTADILNAQGDEKGIEMTLAGISNTVQYMPYLSQIFHDELPLLIPHIMGDEKSKYVAGSLDEEMINKGDFRDNEYTRIKDKNDDKSLDVLITHGQVGDAMFDETRKALPVPYLASAGKLSLEAQLRIEGHLHKSFFSDDVIRPIGAQGAIVKKGEDGKLSVERVDFKTEYIGEREPIKYDLDEFKEELDKILKIYDLRGVDEESSPE